MIAGRPYKGLVMAGQRDPDGTGGGSPMTQTQSSTETTVHGVDEGGNSQYVVGVAAVSSKHFPDHILHL